MLQPGLVRWVLFCGPGKHKPVLSIVQLQLTILPLPLSLIFFLHLWNSSCRFLVCFEPGLDFNCVCVVLWLMCVWSILSMSDRLLYTPSHKIDLFKCKVTQFTCVITSAFYMYEFCFFYFHLEQPSWDVWKCLYNSHCFQFLLTALSHRPTSYKNMFCCAFITKIPAFTVDQFEWTAIIQPFITHRTLQTTFPCPLVSYVVAIIKIVLENVIVRQCPKITSGVRAVICWDRFTLVTFVTWSTH